MTNKKIVKYSDMMQNPMRAQDAQKKKSVMQRLVNWLTGRQGVDVTNHLFPPTYD